MVESWGQAYPDWREQLEIDDLAWERLFRYMEAVKKAPFNLTALQGVALWEKGILDSLAVLRVVGEWRRGMDIGSGAGFPGLVLAIARKHCPITLVEARNVRAQFLLRSSLDLSLENVFVVTERAEAIMGAEKSYREQYDMVTVRAVGSFRMSVELSLPAAQVGGTVVLLRGERAGEECDQNQEFVEELGGRVAALQAVRLPSWPRDVRYLVEIKKMAPTEDRYPRVRHLGV